jgi:hypothetical protein
MRGTNNADFVIDGRVLLVSRLQSSLRAFVAIVASGSVVQTFLYFAAAKV